MNDEIMRTIPERSLVWLESKARESVNPAVVYDPNQLVMANRVIEAQAESLREIQAEVHRLINHNK